MKNRSGQPQDGPGADFENRLYLVVTIDDDPGREQWNERVLPGHRFACVDALLTNFHLPRSTLLLFVAAFAGRKRILAAYRDAVERDYRFYSYGDAMLILDS